MRITGIRERPVPISRYDDPSIPSGGLTTSIVAVQTDVVRGGAPVVGYGFSSIGRFAQSGLIAERFAPRLLAAPEADLLAPGGDNFDPFRAWNVMLAGEKPGGHGERCVAVGTLDMELWDAAAKIADEPLHRFLARAVGRSADGDPVVRVYGGGGYVYPQDDIARLTAEMKRMVELGFTRAKIKIGSRPLDDDLRRIDAAANVLGSTSRLAVDAMNAYDEAAMFRAARAFASRELWWFEDVTDPHDLSAHAKLAMAYTPPIAAGEALFSAAEAKLLSRFGGLRRERDILLFDPAHCYGIPGFLQIVRAMQDDEWPLSAFWPHGGHLYTLHLVAALGLGGCELNPFSFQPFGGLCDDARVHDGTASLPALPGIGFEGKASLAALFAQLDDRRVQPGTRSTR